MHQDAIRADLAQVRVKSLNPFEHYALGLRFTHESLRRNLRTIIRVAEADQDHGDAFLDFVALYIQSLTGHHQVEDAITFPALAATRSDVALFDTFDTDHLSVHRLLEDLARSVDGIRASSPSSLWGLHRIASDLNDALLPHLAIEEATLTPKNLSQMLTPAAMTAAEKKALAEHRKGGSALLMLYIHSLSDEEQTVLFGEEAWFFRTVLVRWTWRRSFNRFLPYAFNRNLAL